MSRMLATIMALAAVGMTACGGDEQGDLQAWCDAYATAVGFGEEEDDFQTIFEAFQAKDEAMAAVAPGEIADISNVVVENMRTLHEYFESHNWDEDSAPADVRIEDEIDDGRTELTAHADSNC